MTLPLLPFSKQLECVIWTGMLWETELGIVLKVSPNFPHVISCTTRSFPNRTLNSTLMICKYPYYFLTFYL